MSENKVNILHDWTRFAFVRQASTAWPHSHRPTVRGGPDNTIVVAYSVLTRGGIGRWWFVYATPDVVDGMQLDPAVVPDPLNSLPVVPRTIACNEPVMPYHYCPDTVLAHEREKRSAHVGYWELQRKVATPGGEATADRMDNPFPWAMILGE